MSDAAAEEQLTDLPGGMGSFRIALPSFEGPLDLLLHLIREHRIDIFDIPIALITEKYLAYLDLMRELNLDIAGEFLVMASTLAHIKSRLLLPQQEQVAQGDVLVEEAGDPRAELVRRLLEYQKYRAVAGELGERPILDRDVFIRRVQQERQPIPDDEVGLREVSVYKLIEALDHVLKALEPKLQHEVIRDRVSISDAIHRVADKLRAQGQVTFSALFEDHRDRGQVVATFLALLEMCRLKLVRVYQEVPLGEILIRAKGEALNNLAPPEVDESEYR